jgi:hypothetical protein
VKIINPSTISLSGQQEVESSQQSLTNHIGNNLKIGDVFYFKAEYVPSGLLRKSNDLTISYDDTCTEQVSNCGVFDGNQNRCEQACPSASTAKIDPSCTTGGSSIEYQRQCVYENGKCRQKSTSFQTSGPTPVRLGSCTYNQIGLGECLDGKQEIKYTIDKDNGQCSPGEIVCTNTNYIPCGRAVAALPFFTMTQLVIAAILIAIVYFIILKVNSSNKIRKRK